MVGPCHLKVKRYSFLFKNKVLSQPFLLILQLSYPVVEKHNLSFLTVSNTSYNPTAPAGNTAWRPGVYSTLGFCLRKYGRQETMEYRCCRVYTALGLHAVLY